MPALDGRGPLGRGPRTGWGFGRCRTESEDTPEVGPPDDGERPAWFWRREGPRPRGWRWRERGGRRFGWGWRD